MAPPEKTFPVSELENRIHLHDVDYREKSRKLPRAFDLKRDCELYELVQYSCTSQAETEERALIGTQRSAGLECYPFVRLFRKCKHGNQEFSVETTAWEGRHKWKPSKRLLEEQAAARKAEQTQDTEASQFAQYGSFFWSSNEKKT